MLHFGLGGVFGGPRREERREPEAPRFRRGEFWRSPRGTVYEVKAEEWLSVVLRNIKSGRRVRRPTHAIRSWVRLHPASEV